MVSRGYVEIRMLSNMLAFVFFLMIRRPPRSTLDRSSAASDVYKRQVQGELERALSKLGWSDRAVLMAGRTDTGVHATGPVSYTHLRAHETVLDLVCRLLLEKKKDNKMIGEIKI